MRNAAFLLFLLCLLGAVSCRQRAAYPPALLRADSLTYADPEAALSLLRSLDAEMAAAPEPVRMYHGLLTVKATDKAYLPHTSDSLMLSLLRHYENGGDPALLPEVYYYAGGTYRDLNDAPRALGYYQKALDAMADDEKSLKVKKTLYFQMGDLFRRQSLFDQAMDMFRNAYTYNNMYADSVNMIYALQNIALIHRRKNDIDSAQIYYHRAKEMAKTIGNKNLVDIVSSQIASLQIELQDYIGAMESVRPLLQHVSSAGLSSIYSIVADIYFKQQQYDSAAYYYNELLTKGEIYAKRRAYERLAHIANVMNNTEKAHDYMLWYENLSDSIQRITATESIEQMEALYNYELREKENLRLHHARERDRALYRTAGIALASVILLLGGVILYYRQRKRLLTLEVGSMRHYQEEQYRRTSQYIEHNQREIQALSEHIDSLRTEIDSLQGERQTLRERNAALLREKEALLARLEQQREKMRHENELARIAVQEKDDATRQIAASGVYAALEGLVASGGHITGDLLNEAERLLDEVCPRFRPALLPHRLSSFNYAVCLLTKMGISSAHIAQLNSRERSTVTHAKKNIYRQLTGLRGKTADFDSFIQSL